MPIYEYKCQACGHMMSLLEKSGAKGPHPCEKCGSEKTEKAFSTFAAHMSNHATAACDLGDRGMCQSRCGGGCPHSR